MHQKLQDWGFALLAFAIGLLALVGVLLFAWHIEDATPWREMQAGDWGVWVGSIGTILAFGGTIWLAGSDRRQRKRQERDLAMVTLAGLSLRIGAVESALSLIGTAFEHDTATGRASNYEKLIELIRSADPWSPSELTALVCLERHLAARLALISAEVDTFLAIMEDAQKLEKYEDPAECARLNEQAGRLLRKTCSSLERAYEDSMRFLRESGVEADLR